MDNLALTFATWSEMFNRLLTAATEIKAFSEFASVFAPVAAEEKERFNFSLLCDAAFAFSD